jgi:hypothetical protein
VTGPEKAPEKAPVKGPGAGPETAPETGPGSVPVLRVVRGTPTAAELAALVTVVSSVGAAVPVDAPRPTSVWAARSRLVRPPLRPGPAAWRASAWPR